MTFTNLQAEVRSRLIEASARFFTDVEIARWVNIGYRDFVARTNWAERLSVVPAVAAQYEYNLPASTIRVKELRWEDQYVIRPLDNQDFNIFMGQAVTTSSSRPEVYTTYPWDKKIRVFPIPSANADATTINIGGGINSSTSTITVASTTNFPSNGRLLIESEQVLYFGKTATTFTGCQRGDGRTTAASHADTTAVTGGSFFIYNTYLPADLSSGSDEPLFDATYHEALADYATALGLLKREKFPQYQQQHERYVERVKRAVATRQQENLDPTAHVKDTDKLDTF